MIVMKSPVTGPGFCQAFHDNSMGSEATGRLVRIC